MQTATIETDASTVDRVWRALERDPRVDARAHPITLAFEDGTLVMEGELADVAAKTRALLLAQVFPRVRRVIDDLVVQPRGSITASSASGVITLEGRVPSLSHARLAGVLAWWIPGTRAVRSALRIDPPEEDSDEEITDAVRIALETEPLLDADQLTVRTAGGRVTLSGTLPSDEQRRIAERDAWYVLGVLDVDNRIQLHSA